MIIKIHVRNSFIPQQKQVNFFFLSVYNKLTISTISCLLEVKLGAYTKFKLEFKTTLFKITMLKTT